MAFDLSSIQLARRDRPKRVVCLGRPKVGKSTFAGEAPNPVFLPIKGEEGIDALNVQAFPVVSSISDLEEALGTLYNEDHEFKTVVIDSISALELIIWDRVCKEDGAGSIEKVGKGYGKGYLEALKWWRYLLTMLDAMRDDRNIGCILIGHVRVKKFNDPQMEPYDRYSCDVNEKAVELITRWADGTLFLQRKVKVVKEGEGLSEVAHAKDMTPGRPYMYTQERPAHPGGGRGLWGNLPYELPLSWEALNNALAQVAAAAQ